MIEDKDSIRMYITNFGCVAGQIYEAHKNLESGRVKLIHPLRLVPGQEGQLVVAALFVKEEWCKVSLSQVVEISVDDRVKQLYVDYEAKVFSSIIIPEKSQIII